MPRKNLAELAGFPLIAYSVVAARAARDVDRVVVTTDSQEIADVAGHYGAEVPFLRPTELAADDSLDIDYVRHALDELADGDIELIVQLRPTTPLRDPARLDAAVAVLRSRDDASGLRSVHALSEPPQKMLGVDAEGLLTGLFPDDTRPEYFNLPRQAFPPAYWPNGYVDVVRVRTVRDSGTLYGSRVLGFVTDPVVELDGPAELDYLHYVVGRGHPLLDLLRDG